MAKTLAAHGGGAVAFDLALDLVLNEVVEQARDATGASGAAIALARDGEMVCRATTGADSLGLGVRLETSGLSGACLKSGQIQYCSDTEIDERVDAEACRQLNVRSMVVVPLDGGKGPFGILEVLSARPNAFGQHDIDVLRRLASRVVASKDEADKGFAAPTFEEEPSNAIRETQPTSVSGNAESREEAVIVTTQAEPPNGSDIWTTVLALLVIAAAVTLGVLIGWRGAARRWTPEPVAKASPATSQVSAAKESFAPPSIPAAPQETKEPLKTVPAASSNVHRPDPSLGGGLLVTQNGKVVYRMPPSFTPRGDGSRNGSSGDDPTGRLIHRVDPEYPLEAKTGHIQGSVALDVQILDDGSVGNIEIAAGNPLLAQAAVQAVRQWRYQPYVVDGHPVGTQTKIKINFVLPAAN
jgi:TonB family protein